MAYTSSQLDTLIATLESALSKGHASVAHEGTKTEYHTPAEILKGIQYFRGLRQTLVAESSGQRRSLISGRLVTSKGF